MARDFGDEALAELEKADQPELQDSSAVGEGTGVAEPSGTPTPETEPPPSTQSQTPTPHYTLDDALPDDPRIPPSLRGKPLSALIEDRHTLDMQAKQAGFQKNAERERAEAFKTALEVMGRQKAEPAPQRTGSDEITRRGVAPETMYRDAGKYTDATIAAARDAGRDAAVDAVDPDIKALKAQLATLQAKAEAVEIQGAFRAAKPDGMQDSEWNAVGNINVLSAFVAAAGLDPKDPASFRQADEILEKDRPRRAAKTSPVTVPAVPAPPVGNDRSAPKVSKSTARVSPHVMGAFNEITDILNSSLPAGSKQVTTETVLDGMRKDGRYREMFQE